MKCPHCGKDVKDGASYCEHCGKKLNSPTSLREKSETGEGGAEKRSGEAIKDAETGRNETDGMPKKGVFFRGPGLILLLLLVAVVFWFWKRDGHHPPIPEGKVSTGVGDGNDFFVVWRERIQEVGNAKSYYLLAQKMMLSPASPETETAASQPSESAPQTRLLAIAENFSRALERFRHAKQLTEDMKESKLDDNIKHCKHALIDAVGQYADSAEILSGVAKSRYEGDDKDPGTLLSDAKVKYEMGEKLMSEMLLNGCNGEFFTFLKTSSNNAEQKGLAYQAYKNFFGDGFPLQKAVVERLLQYSLSPESQGKTPPLPGVP